MQEYFSLVRKYLYSNAYIICDEIREKAPSKKYLEEKKQKEEEKKKAEESVLTSEEIASLMWENFEK